jgi:NADP-dependent 3-hydroxy acid dehydrogenase YdfG
MQKSIFITGAAKGIGRATALHFAKNGWFVGVFDVDEKGVRELSAEIGAGSSYAGVLDVTDYDAYAKSVASFEHAIGRMDALFNNAGILRMGFFEEIPPKESKRQIDINIMGVINGIYASLPLLERTAGSTIVSMSSASAIYGTPELAVYSATKFAVRALTEALDIEFRRKKIRVVDIMPSYVATDMVSDQKHRAKTLSTMGVKLKPEDISELVWKAVTLTSGWKKGVHFTAKRDLDVFIRLAGFQGLSRPLMRRFSKM